MELSDKAGFDGVELDCSGPGINADDLYRLSVDHNMPVKNIIAPSMFSKKPLSRLFNGDFILFSFYENLRPDNIVLKVPLSLALKSLFCFLFRDKILYLKKKYGNNIIAIENNAPSNISYLKPIMNIKAIRDFAYEHDVFINFDVSNCAASGKDILLSYDMIAPRVKSVHFSDFGGTKGMSHLIPGKGLLPLGMQLSRMKQFNFNGNISFEIDPKELEKYDEGETVTLYKELIGYVKSYF